MKRAALILAGALALTGAPTADGHYWPGCQKNRCKRHVVKPYLGWLARTAWCESTDRWHIATGNGFYGGLQFTASSWRAVGGSGLPHRHSRLEQSYRAVKLLHLQGAGAWPVCGA